MLRVNALPSLCLSVTLSFCLCVSVSLWLTAIRFPIRGVAVILMAAHIP